MQEAEDQRTRAGGDEPPFTGEKLMVAVNQARVRVIIPKLRSVGLARWADDVAGEVALSAWKSRERFDPNLGALQSWVNRIAQYRSADRIEAESRRNGDLLAERDGDGLSVDEQLARAEGDRSDHVADVAESVAERMAIEEWLRPIMFTAARVMDPTAFVHGLHTHMLFDCDVKAAARVLGISEARVREHKRSLELYAQVIHRALEKGRTLTDGVRLSDVVDCLPEPGVAGSWARQMGEAVVSWPGRIDDVPVEHVMKKTGWTYDTSRQYLATTRSLLSVALGVIEAERANTKERVQR